ncbi:alpha/beta hydrolase [Moorena bouillonii]|uniref:alpha/beta hydrolase n=1 Tax=Moorena bouillonii TaxID=207920 RepID=UPI001E3DAA91|nr:alpha/beta hydrolase [Moorena bouillonii]
MFNTLVTAFPLTITNSPSLSRAAKVSTQSFNSNPLRQWLTRFSLSLGLSLVSTFSAIPALGAERITFFVSPFGQFNIGIEDLEIFAKDGTMTRQFAYYANFATPTQLAALRILLNSRFNISPRYVYLFTRLPVGKTLLRRLGNVIKADFNRNGFYPLRGALISAASDPEGLSVINVLRKFSLETIYLDVELISDVTDELSRLFVVNNVVFSAIKNRAQIQTKSSTSFNFSAQADLRNSGGIGWRKETFEVYNSERQASFPVDIYLPKSSDQGGIRGSIPTLVISHGLASDRNTFAYLAQHLASYGFAVAVPEHIGTSSERINQIFAGFATPLNPTAIIHRPLDVKYLLDELSAKANSDPSKFGKLNLEEVGVIGQSFGGYTVLALGGAKLNFEQLTSDCDAARQNNSSLDVSLLLQCRGTQLPPEDYNLGDERVKAVIAVNPLSNPIFGETGMSQIQVPVMMVSSIRDIFAPPVEQQITPFSWLTTPENYLVVTEAGTHFSYLGGAGEGVLPVPPELIGPDPAIARPYLMALSTAFFKTYIAKQPQYASYLSESYVKEISQDPLNLFLLKSF